MDSESRSLSIKHSKAAKSSARHTIWYAGGDDFLAGITAAKQLLFGKTITTIRLTWIRERSVRVQMQGGNDVDYTRVYQRVANAADVPLPGVLR